jgi:RimJ/RimL family protein N-acetyltransferase
VIHRSAPTLETERLRLRAHRLEDFEPIFAMVSDDALMRHISGAQPREEAWRRMLTAPGCWALLGYGYWVVERREDGRLLGQAGLADFKRDMQPSIEGLPELGYVFAAHAHGQGYATEAARAVLGWADETLGAPEVVAIIDRDNLPSIRVAERTGFSVRQDATYKGEPLMLFRRPAGSAVAEARAGPV